MSSSHSKHDPRTDPPGAISDQNREEAQSAHRNDETHPEPRTREHSRTGAHEGRAKGQQQASSARHRQRPSAD